MTYKYIYEWHQVTAAVVTYPGIEKAIAGGKAGVAALGRLMSELLEKIPVLDRTGLPQTMK